MEVVYLLSKKRKDLYKTLNEVMRILLEGYKFEDSTYLDYRKTQKHFIVLQRECGTHRNKYISNLFNFTR